MRTSLFLCVLLLSGKLFAGEAVLDELFIPKGFDNNDNVEVVVTGKFPNPCYIHNEINVKFVGEKIIIDVTSVPREIISINICERLIVPFSETVSLGNLQAGQYQVVINEFSSGEKKGKLLVNEATSNSVDDHLYAQVDYVDLGFTGGLSGDAILSGHTLSPCMVFDKVKYISNGNDTFSILPIMKKISNNCPEKKSPLRIPIKFNPHQLKSSKILLFVRSIDGKSVISFIEK